MVKSPELYSYSSHREYLGQEPVEVADTDPVLRRFAVRKMTAIDRFEAYVREGIGHPHQEKFYAAEGGILGSDEFADSMIHRIGEHDVYAAARRRKEIKAADTCDTEKLVDAVAKRFGIPKEDLCSRRKTSQVVDGKEVLILCGRRLGASLAELSDLIGVNASTVSRRYDAARLRNPLDAGVSAAVADVIRDYERSAAT
jgi:hypothetical protein